MLATLAVGTRRLLNYFGLGKDLAPDGFELPFWCPDMARRHARIFRSVRPYTMTGFDRVASLCQSTAYLEANDIDGAVVECCDEHLWLTSDAAGIESVKTLAEIRRSLDAEHRIPTVAPIEFARWQHPRERSRDRNASEQEDDRMWKTHQNVGGSRFTPGSCRYASAA